MSCDHSADLIDVFTVVQGDGFPFAATRTSGTGVWSGDLLVQLRAGTTADAPLVATSGTPPPDVGEIDTTGTDLSAAEIRFVVPASVTADLTAGGLYTVEAEAELDGLPRTLLSHRLRVAAQVAVEVGP